MHFFFIKQLLFSSLFCFLLLLYKKTRSFNMAKWVKITAFILLSILALVILVAGSYIIYLSIQYYRIEDNQVLAIDRNIETKVALNTDYSISTYNIGFGAYTQDFSFFMDSGTMKNGKKVTGTGSTAKNKETVLANTQGAIDAVKSNNYDFMLFQEVDTDATRSHKTNQYAMLSEQFSNYATTFAVNFHSGFLCYPINDPHGYVNAGIATYSKYKIGSSVRRQLPIDNGFFAKFFDLDRCLSINRLPIESSDKEFVLINLHLSAYDKGGIIRAQQLEVINKILEVEYEKGNYIVVGGDFNHDIVESINLFETEQEVPEWVFQLFNSNLAEHFSFSAATNCPTCRSTDIPYTKGVNYSVVIDGFIVSDNVTVINNSNIDTDFTYSDHNPATMTFKLA